MKIGLLITARLKSSRLPFKLLKDLNGYSIIEHVINRAKTIKNVDAIILCTSNNKQDRPLVEVALENNIYSFLGSEEDVLQRLNDCSQFFGLDYIVSITGENPLFSVDYANILIDKMVANQADFTYIDHLPIGCAVYGIKSKALELVCEIKSEIDTEIWGPLLNQPEVFKVQRIEANTYLQIPNLRLTNDYQEDFHMMTCIFNQFPHCSSPSLESVLQLLHDKPEILKINAEKKQMALDPEVLQRINQFYIDNLDKILDLKLKIYEK
ncbi:3-deoxy-manno-octulosonate cytidylyltransferase [Chryseobacterium sp. SSA4.19]|uniref:cytidylyltransferase domain-containing protein n=1 Tax=Chryseobacterium sp. SSA4.19 TaxID=2919915 RepID=UPI001F4D58DF|nr:hypothetical protein [Chryseobacterium sp. SSA4.19]MCJ8152358.1 3-deoxy-manno-octulosonate cytidylyltransferase [Chryseobacterium sp. SSA4.19]